MDELKMSIEEMISMLDGAAGRLIVASMENTTIKEAMEMVTNVSISLGEWATDGLPQNRWIPVTERLPDENEKVLIYARVGIITVGWYTEMHGVYYNKGFETESGFMWLGTVPYWMPLPEEPKEEDNAKENSI